VQVQIFAMPFARLPH